MAHRADVAVVGNEGSVGVSLFMGGETTSSRAIVQRAGDAYRLKEQLLKDEFDRAGLEARACECYAMVKKESCRLFPEAKAH